MKKEVDIRCKKCKSKLTYIRMKSNVRKCRSCGYEEKLDTHLGERGKPLKKRLKGG